MRQRESKVKPSDVPASEEREGERGEGEEGDGGRGETRPSTPPPKEEAFEQFKRERGSEINKILLSNKGQWFIDYNIEKLGGPGDEATMSCIFME